MNDNAVISVSTADIVALAYCVLGSIHVALYLVVVKHVYRLTQISRLILIDTYCGSS